MFNYKCEFNFLRHTSTITIYYYDEKSAINVAIEIFGVWGSKNYGHECAFDRIVEMLDDPDWYNGVLHFIAYGENNPLFR